MIFNKYFWVIHSHVYNPNYLKGSKKSGYMYLEAYPRERINRIPIIPLEVCVYNDGVICGRAHFFMDHKNEDRGPFSLSCSFCGLEAGPFDTVEKLAEAWNREVIAKKVLVAL